MQQYLAFVEECACLFPRKWPHHHPEPFSEFSSTPIGATPAYPGSPRYILFPLGDSKAATE